MVASNWRNRSSVYDSGDLRRLQAVLDALNQLLARKHHSVSSANQNDTRDRLARYVMSLAATECDHAKFVQGAVELVTMQTETQADLTRQPWVGCNGRSMTPGGFSALNNIPWPAATTRSLPGLDWYRLSIH